MYVFPDLLLVLDRVDDGAGAEVEGPGFWTHRHTLLNATGSSVVEQWAEYPEVAGSIPARFQLFINVGGISEKNYISLGSVYDTG